MLRKNSKYIYEFIFIAFFLLFLSIPLYSINEYNDIDIVIGDENYTNENMLKGGLSDEDTPGILIKNKNLNTDEKERKRRVNENIKKENNNLLNRDVIKKEKCKSAKMVKKERGYIRPIAIMVENEYPARPQSGLFEAKYVFEIVAEEITRFMPIFYEYKKGVEVGPVRSARDYFADISTMFDAVYAHCGGSPRGLKFIKENSVNDIDAIRGDRGFYRSKDRKIPHNLYTKLDKMKKEIKRKKYREYTEKFIPFSFYDKKKTFEVECKKVIIPYYRRYKVEYRYLKDRNIYRRYYRGKPFRGKKTGKFHDIDNIIIQRIKTKMVDSAMRHEMDLYSGGSAEILIGGKLIRGRWSRDQSGNFVYVDKNFEDILFNPGKIWINFVEPELKVKFIK